MEQQVCDKIDQSGIVYLASCIVADVDKFVEKVEEKNELLNSTLNL